MTEKITAKTINDLLEAKHINDVFVSECKMGSAGSRILDGWAMGKSWARPWYVGYEIKVNRGDFLQDEKYDNYFKVCNRFYWVCPHGLIDASEVGDNCGLIWVSRTGNRLITKKKAPALIPDKQALASLMKYVLMYRVKICESTFGRTPGPDNREYWESWLLNKEQKQLLGRSVSNELHRRVFDQIDAVKKENSKLTAQNYRLEDVKKYLQELGIDPSGYVQRFSVDRALMGGKYKLIAMLNSLIKESNKALEMLEKTGDTDD